MTDQCKFCDRADCPRYNGIDIWCEPEPCRGCGRATLCKVHGFDRTRYPAHCHRGGVPDPTCDVFAAAYQRGLAEAKWRPIPDGVTENTRRCVLVYTPNGIHPRCEVAHWGAWAYWSAKPTHYMELPSPPEGT